MKQRTLTLDKRTGKYYARIQVGGVRKKFYFGKNRRKAEQDLRKLEAEVAEGNKSVAAIANPRVDRATPSDITIEELITRYLEWVEGNRAKSTYETKKIVLQPFLDFYGDCKVSDINHSTLSKYYVWAKRTRGRSDNGGNRHYREVKSAFRWGEDMDVCVCPVRRFPVMREAPAKTKKFNDAELPILLDHAQPDFRDLILFGLLTGLRPQELRELRREHIRQVGESMCVVLEKHKASRSMHLAQPRCVPLSPQALQIADRQMRKHDSSFVFLNDRNKPYTAGGFRQRLERACERAGIPRRPPYALRHYFGTKRAGEGLNQAVLAQLMGHTTIVTTTRYVAKVPDYHQKAVDAMEADLSGILGSARAPEPPDPKPDLRILGDEELRKSS